MTESVLTVIDRVVTAADLPQSPRTLVLGDPAACICSGLRTRGHLVECCPDLQRVPGTAHDHVVAPTLDALLDLSTTWDLAVAVDGFRRMQDVHAPRDLAEFLSWLADHASVVVIEAPRIPLAPDLHDLGPYLTREFLAAFPFVTEFTSPNDRSAENPMPPPILVASRSGLLHAGAWLPADELTLVGRDLGESPVSTYRHGDSVIKTERASNDYFERCEASAEALALTTVDDDVRDSLRLPRVLSWVQGRAVSTLSREWVAGTGLSPGSCRDGGVPISAVIGFAARWARAGLFHNDLRPWNLLWDGSTITVVDYADVAGSDRDVQGLPQVLALAGTIAALMTEDLPWGEGFLDTLLAASAEVGVGERWRTSELLDAPWLSLPSRADALADSLEALTSRDATAVVSTVLETLMDGHSVGARDV